MQTTDIDKVPLDARHAPKRRSCPLDCRMAPYKPGGVIENLEFSAAKLCDIGMDGCSYWTARWPTSTEVALAMTEGMQDVLIAHVGEVLHEKGGYIVDCTFIGRLGDSEQA